MKKIQMYIFLILFSVFMPLLLNGRYAFAAGIIMPTRELTLYTGDSYSLEADASAGLDTGSIEYYLYDEAKHKRVKSSSCLNLDSINGEITALKPGSISVVVYCRVWNNSTAVFDEYQDKCQVTVVEDVSKNGLNHTYINRAVGSKKVKLTVKNAKKSDVIIWKSSNKKVAGVGKNGRVIAKSPGKATITAAIQRKKKTLTYFCEVNVSSPVIDKNMVVLSPGEISKVNISGVSDENAVQWVVNDSRIALMSIDGTVMGKEEGTTTVNVKAEGISIELVIHVEKPAGNAASANNVRLVKGEEEKLVPKGLAAGTFVSWSSNSKETVSVDNDGKIRALSVGNALITAEFGSESVTYHVSVGNNKKAVEAVEKGESLLGCAYSTEKRMEEGYYDCSSYVFRIFAPLGYLFGCENAKENAPTAADLAKWCEENQCVVSMEPVQNLGELLPGDLIFYSYGGGNGRFLNIDHVAIYNGYGTIIHASDEETGVKQGRYWVDNYIVMVARPAG